eukprot:268560-Amphidinium_carterae.1
MSCTRLSAIRHNKDGTSGNKNRVAAFKALDGNEVVRCEMVKVGLQVVWTYGNRAIAFESKRFRGCGGCLESVALCPMIF